MSDVFAIVICTALVVFIGYEIFGIVKSVKKKKKKNDDSDNSVVK